MAETSTPPVWDNGTAPHASLAEALAAFHTEAPSIIKDATAKVVGENKSTGEKVKYTYGYADLATVTEALNPLLGKHGLAFTSKPTMTEQGFGLVYALKHEGGEVDEGFWPLPDPARMKPQDIGSLITYWRRYAFLASTNTFPGGEDDDGQKAQEAPRDSWGDARPVRQAPDRQQQAGQEPQADPAPAAPKTSWTDEEVAAYVAKMATAELPATIKAYDWMASKGLHNRKVGPSQATATDAIARRIAEGSFAGSVDEIAELKEIADGRGLLKVQVSETETLDQVLYEARELAVHAAVEASGEVDSNTRNGVE